MKITKHEKKTIRKIGYDWDPKRMSITMISATDNHPFWVEGIGWRRADLLKEGDLLRKADGSLTKVEFQYPIYQFHDPSTGEPKPGIGWVQIVDELGMMMDPANGDLFDYENYRLLSGDSEGELDWDNMTEENYLQVTVYNLEVEDFHTYYVGRGLWVHNTNCAEKSVRLFNPLGDGKAPVEELWFPGPRDANEHAKRLLAEGKKLHGYAVVDVPDIRNKIKRPQYDENGMAILDENGHAIEIDEIIHMRETETEEAYLKEWGNKFLRVEGHEVVNGVDITRRP